MNSCSSGGWLNGRGGCSEAPSHRLLLLASSFLGPWPAAAVLLGLWLRSEAGGLPGGGGGGVMPAAHNQWTKFTGRARTRC